MIGIWCAGWACACPTPPRCPPSRKEHSDDVRPLFPAALTFLQELKANNTRDWFTDHKAVYDKEIKAPAQAFCADATAALAQLTGAAHSAKVFRIHRDVRFSKDKTPYNTHLHIAFSPEGGPDTPPMWFFGLDTEKLTLGCGVFEYAKSALEQFRADMAGPKGAALIALADGLEASGHRIGAPALKNPPRGYDRDHPNAAALRRKGFSAWTDLPCAAATQSGLVDRVSKEFQALLPVYRLLGGPGA